MSDKVNGTTCFSEHSKRLLKCNKTECRLWLENEKFLNCTIIATKNGPQTLQDIGDIFGISRMRVCQVEKKIIRKCKEKINQVIQQNLFSSFLKSSS